MVQYLKFLWGSPFHSLAHIVIIRCQIHSGGSDTAMAECALHNCQISSRREQPPRKAMAQRVRRCMLQALGKVKHRADPLQGSYLLSVRTKTRSCLVRPLRYDALY